jgi:hypothetical protein
MHLFSALSHLSPPKLARALHPYSSLFFLVELPVISTQVFLQNIEPRNCVVGETVTVGCHQRITMRLIDRVRLFNVPSAGGVPKPSAQGLIGNAEGTSTPRSQLKNFESGRPGPSLASFGRIHSTVLHCFEHQPITVLRRITRLRRRIGRPCRRASFYVSCRTTSWI